MDCTICGKPALPGAMLCAPCKAALKRARYVTVQEDMRRPSIIDVRRQPRRGRKPVPAPEAALPAPLPMAQESNANLGRRIFIGIFVLAAALGGASYFGLRELGARSHDDASAAPMPAAEVRQEPAASVAAPQNEEAAAALPPIAASIVAPIATPQVQAVTKLAGTAAAKRTMLTGSASFATANGDPPDAVAPPPEPEKIAVAPPPPPRPIPDRWQNMSDALAQCDREGVIGGLICGQRVRIQYCDGYWGKVAQCPSAAAAYER
jgi:hypothetical protein